MLSRCGLFVKLLRLLPVPIMFACGCGFEGAMDRFGDQLAESLDKTPATLSEVSNPVKPPPGVPCSDTLGMQMVPESTATAVYPERLRKKGVKGKATVMLVVDSTGAIVNPQITHATDTSFARALMDAVRTWKIAPCQENGRPITCYKMLTIEFALH
jgi:TonB family protein